MKFRLEADGIRLDFGNRNVLSAIYLKCETGKITGLLGRNGAGKSCLMNVIYGRLAPQSKSVRINNVPVSRPWRRTDLIRYAPQFHFIPDSFSVKKVFRDFEVDFWEFCKHFKEVEPFYKTSVKMLSGGFRRLVEIYVILRCNTAFVMLDEPFSHLMPRHIERLAELLSEEKKNKGILISDHLYEHIMDVSDSLFLLNQGNTFPIHDRSELQRRGYLRGLS